MITEDVVEVGQHFIDNIPVFTTSLLLSFSSEFLKFWSCSMVLFYSSGNLEVKLLSSC